MLYILLGMTSLLTVGTVLYNVSVITVVVFGLLTGIVLLKDIIGRQATDRIDVLMKDKWKQLDLHVGKHTAIQVDALMVNMWEQIDLYVDQRLVDLYKGDDENEVVVETLVEELEKLRVDHNTLKTVVNMKRAVR